MRIAYVTMSFPAGSETFASNDVRTLVANGADVTVHSLRGPRPDALLLRDERGLGGVSVTYHAGLRTVAQGVAEAVRRPQATLSLLSLVLHTCARTPRHLVKSVALLPRVFEIARSLRLEQPDVVHAYWAHYPSLVLHLVQQFMPRVVTSISFSAYDIRARFPVSGPVARRADVVRSLSLATADEAAEAFGIPRQSIEVIPDGVDLGLVPAEVPRARRRILTAGRLIAAKGMDRVIHAFADVYRRHPDATLRVLGAGPDKRRLSSIATELGVAPAVTFLGHVSQVRVLVEMREAELFLFLSKDERLPNVVKEAMLCGCVVVVSKTVGIDELVEDGVSGFVIEQGDHSGAVERMGAALEDRTGMHRMIEAAEAHVRRRFDLGVTAARYLQLWQIRMEERDRNGVPTDA